MMVDDYKRQTAFLCTAQQLLEGSYVRREGWEPSYLATDAGMLARVRMAGVVVSAPPGEGVFDDGTGSVLLRSLAPLPSSLRVGVPVLVIGRPRVMGDQSYVMAEIVRVLSSPAWVQFYKDHASFFQQFIPPLPVPETTPQSAPLPVMPKSAPTPPSSSASSLIDIIAELDPGDGAPVDEVLARAGSGADERLSRLIAEGEVFELRAGKVKVLD